MAEEKKDERALQEKTREAAGAQSLTQLAATLVKFGGFGLLESTLDGAQNLNPEKKARKASFLMEDGNKEERKALLKRLTMISELLNSADSVSDMVQSAQDKVDASQALLSKNVKSALDETRTLEVAYRSVSNFYKNAERDKIPNAFIINAPWDQLTDLENDTFIKAIDEELQSCYDRLDLRENYSILSIPGYLGSKKVVDAWARLAHKNKVMLITDFKHLDAPSDVIELFTKEDLTGGDIYLSNVMMTCNYLVGRGKAQEVGEEDDVYVPPSTALAGKVYGTLMSQVAAGRKYGALNEVDGVRFPLRKGEIAQIEKIGLIPMVNEFGKVMPYSAKTLFNGDNLGLQTYSVVRVFDYVTKVLMDFLNRRAFQNFNVNTRMDIQKQIVKFLDGITGPGKLIEKFKLIRLEQDPNQKDRIYLDIHMVPYFPAKNFVIKLDGRKGDDFDSPEWKAEYAQQA